MKQLLWLTSFIVCFTAAAMAQTMDIKAGDGFVNEVIEADTLGDGSQAHNVYRLVTLDTTYKFTGSFKVGEDLTIMGVVDDVTGRPPCIQPAVLPDQTIAGTPFLINQPGISVTFENIYFMALAPNNTGSGGGICIRVTADNVKTTINNCVFDSWQNLVISYNANWDKFFINNCHFRNLVHPNQWYIGEVLRNEWPGEVYTDTVSMVGNTMLCLNGYASAPVTKFYQKYFEFIGNKVLYTFKNPFFIFNTTEGKINDNIFYANYSGGVDTTENPWWDNLWYPDTSFGVIAMQPLNVHNAKMFVPQDSSKADSTVLAIAESKRTIEVKNNTYFWPQTVKDFWTTWNNTQANTITTPVFMNDRTVAMFADDVTYPYLIAENNVESDPGFMDAMNDEILNGTPDDYNLGFFDYFTQIRTGTAATDYWGYQLPEVGPTEDWVPIWPLPENEYITAIESQPEVAAPSRFALNEVYPNPFNPSTTVSYTLKEAGNISLTVYNVLGQKVKTLIHNEFRSANSYKMSVDMSGFSSGMYFVVLKQGSLTSSKKMMLLK